MYDEETLDAVAVPELPVQQAGPVGLDIGDLSGPPIEKSQHVEAGTGGASAIAYCLVIGGNVVAAMVTFGISLLGIPFVLIADFFNRKKVMASLHGSGLQVNEHQLPEVYAAAQSISRRMGLQEVPDVYIVEGSVMNAVAARIGARKVVVLIDDVVDACLRTGNNDALAFLLAHEIAHHAYGHTGMLRSYCSTIYKALSRKDEFTCDAAAAAVVSGEAAYHALGVMLSGPQLLPYVNQAALAAQAREVEANKVSKKAERTMTHPLLLRRISRFC